MLMRTLILYTAAAVCLIAQASKSNRPPSDEAGFRKAVLDGLPSSTDRAAGFAHNHEEVAIPILMEAIKARIIALQAVDEKDPDRFLWVAVQMITYNGSQRAIDAVAELCSIDQKDCHWMVTDVLAGGRTQHHPYATACDVAEQHPKFLDFVAPFVERGLSFSEETLFAQELLKREKAGRPIQNAEPLLSRLSREARWRLDWDLQTARNEEQQRRGK
jgi:hypothetical protein